MVNFKLSCSTVFTDYLSWTHCPLFNGILTLTFVLEKDFSSKLLTSYILFLPVISILGTVTFSSVISLSDQTLWSNTTVRYSPDAEGQANSTSFSFFSELQTSFDSPVCSFVLNSISSIFGHLRLLYVTLSNFLNKMNPNLLIL